MSREVCLRVAGRGKRMSSLFSLLRYGGGQEKCQEVEIIGT